MTKNLALKAFQKEPKNEIFHRESKALLAFCSVMTEGKQVGNR